MSEYQLTATDTISRTSDGVSIPADPNNRDRAEYDAWLNAGGVPASYMSPPRDYKGDAQTAIDASDLTMIRCVENGVTVPVAWQTYRASLRLIIKSGQGPLPGRPAYPAGT